MTLFADQFVLIPHEKETSRTSHNGLVVSSQYVVRYCVQEAVLSVYLMMWNDLKDVLIHRTAIS